MRRSVNTMKVGLLTYHASINPGAFWQCFATCQLLQRLGHEELVLDYRNPRWHSRNPFAAIFKLKFWTRPVSVFCLVRAQFRHRRDLRMLPVSEPLVDLSPRDPGLDALVVGSDVVWRHPFDPVYFGQVFRCSKTVAYAVSMGGKAGDSVRIPDFLWKPTPFTSISCRDENTTAILRFRIRPHRRLRSPRLRLLRRLPARASPALVDPRRRSRRDVGPPRVLRPGGFSRIGNRRAFRIPPSSDPPPPAPSRVGNPPAPLARLLQRTGLARLFRFC